MLQLAEHILDSKAGDFDPSQFQDRYEEAVVAMIRSKQAGMPATAAKPAFGGKSNVIALMDALRRSLGAAPKPAPVSKAKKPSKRAAGQGEMLLPIAGKGAPKEAAEKQVATAKPSKASTGRKAG
jgi:DNA end-binding protein Ku